MTDLTAPQARAASGHPNARLEAFSDGVFAIALTLLILEVKLPSTDTITTTSQLWRELGFLGPTIVAFGLSYVIIFITWVNHRAMLRLVDRSSSLFLYGNGFLLLTVVALPFPTGMLGQFLGTDHASPAVVLYNALLAAQAIGWVVLSNAALRGGLTIDEASRTAMQESNRNGYFAFALYSLLAVGGFWLPSTAVVITMLSWLFWLALSIRMTQP